MNRPNPREGKPPNRTAVADQVVPGLLTILLSLGNTPGIDYGALAKISESVEAEEETSSDTLKMNMRKLRSYSTRWASVINLFLYTQLLRHISRRGEAEPSHTDMSA